MVIYDKNLEDLVKKKLGQFFFNPKIGQNMAFDFKGPMNPADKTF